ncbi:DUF2336 domain-containing protein [Terrarubrum flagellatum]|uniref:DUF2336 domain-containing protein n=1 Tax=Terrirubrum flagellatum TaxID=2895980 RepID=UPI003145675B
MQLIEELSKLSDETSSDRRRELLRKVTDLFLSNNNYAEQQVGFFNDIMTMVADSVTTEVRAEFADRIADRSDAPLSLIERLASDDLQVASPILRRSPVLTDDKLAAIASTSSQDHLLAISNRQQISEIITDVLVRRGDQRVVRNVAGNQGARFSQTGFGELVRKAEGDQELQMRLVARQDLPAETVEKLLPQLSEQLVVKLAEAGYDKDGRLPAAILRKVRQKLHDAMVFRDEERRKLDAMVDLMKTGAVKLPDLVQDLATEDRIHDLAYVLSRVSGLDLSLCGSALFNPPHEPVVLLLRSQFLPWPAFAAVSAMRARKLGDVYRDDPRLEYIYNDLKPSDAQRSLRFIKISSSVGSAAPPVSGAATAA